METFNLLICVLCDGNLVDRNDAEDKCEEDVKGNVEDGDNDDECDDDNADDFVVYLTWCWRSCVWGILSCFIAVFRSFTCNKEVTEGEGDGEGNIVGCNVGFGA